jgi:hypothetical protein
MYAAQESLAFSEGGEGREGDEAFELQQQQPARTKGEK